MTEEWFDISATIPVSGYNVTGLFTLSSEGAGRGVMLSLRDQRTEELYIFVMSPQMAGLAGWEMTGVANDYAEMFEEDPRSDEDDE